MHILRRAKILFGLSCMVFTAASAAGGTSNIEILNNGPDALVTTVYDLNADPLRPVIESQRIEGFSWISVLVTLDAQGNANLYWMTQTTDDDFRLCGHRRRLGIANHAVVRVIAENRCSNVATGLARSFTSNPGGEL